MPKIQFNHNKKISEYLKNKNGYDKRNHFIEITKIRNTRFTISYHLKFKFTGIKKKHTVCHSEERGISSSYSNYEIPRSSEWQHP
ncbi:hypothetical protein [Flavobacterium psychrophilum]|uniref:hypothetical protein n=1 Tax=Flavobacterium psychrophilum TaxID=96345 RepID=UPI001D0609FC|nr:hypothetical protein [Flavobacterium psychrophilum]MCB6099269.1 hypothetical protein [Flavobacterium psychrophilum]